MLSSNRRFAGSIGTLQLGPDPFQMRPVQLGDARSIDHHCQVSEAVNQALVTIAASHRIDCRKHVIAAEANMTKRPRDLRLSRFDLTRRAALFGGTAVLLAPAYLKQASAQEKRIFIRDPGGPYAPGFKEAFYEPFTKATGIEAVGLEGPHEPTSLIKGMVDTKTYTWDMALLSLSASNQLRAEGTGYLEKLNVKTPYLDTTPAEYKTEYFAGNNVFATILAYRTDAYEGKGKEPPKSWADLFEPKKVVGRRSMRKHPFDTIEQALLADGVPGEKLYPLHSDRAFKKLDTIKKDIAVWWTGGAQTSQ